MNLRSMRVPGAALRWLTFPTLVVAAFLVMVGLNLSGSSIALLDLTGAKPGLVAGQPRTIRSDEFVLQTPIAISSARQDYPRTPYVGLNRIDQMATAHGGPTREWETVAKPQDWGYLLGAGRGLAWSWWASFAIGLLGCYALLAMLTRRPLLSSLLAVAAVFTPYTGWWSAPAPALFLGYAAATAAFMLAAWTVRSRPLAAAAAVGSGLSGFALVLALYPPWQISLAWIIVPAALGFALDKRVPWRRFGATIGGAAVVAAVCGGLWYVQHRGAITAQADTIYPGQRVSPPGTASLKAMLDSPLNFWLSGTTGARFGGTENVSLGNLSEAASSWLPLPIMALLVLGTLELLVRRFVPRRGAARHEAARHEAAPESSDAVAEPGGAAAVDRPPVWTLTFVSAGMLLLLGWSLLDLPEFVGKITQLQRVTPSRTPLAIGLAVILLIGVASTVSRERRPLFWWWPVGIVGIAATAALTVYVDHRLPWDDRATPFVLVALSGVLLAAGCYGLLVPRFRAVSALLLAGYAALSWGQVNPLQHGIAPLTSDATASALRNAAGLTGDDVAANPRTMVFVADPRVSFTLIAQIRSAGFQSIAGTTPYPDASLMRKLAPTQEPLWNNYLQYTWQATAPGTPPRIVQTSGTQVTLQTPVCQPLLIATTKPGWVVADRALSDACLRPAAVVSKPRYPKVWIYRVQPNVASGETP